MKLYLASPYSSPNEATRQDRFESVCRKSAELIQAGHVVFSPISHSHPIAFYMDNHNDSSFWVDQDLAFIPWCDEVWVCRIDGYLQSAGIRRETEEAKRLGKPVRFIEA